MGGLWLLCDGERRPIADRWTTYGTRHAAAMVSLASTGRSIFADAVPFNGCVDDLPIGAGRLYLDVALLDRLWRCCRADYPRLRAAKGVRHNLFRRPVRLTNASLAQPMTISEVVSGLDLLRWSLCAVVIATERGDDPCFFEWS
jgi:hypothetical protein